MNDDNQTKRRGISKRLLFFVALTSIAVSVLLLLLVIKFQIQGGFVWLEKNPNPETVKDTMMCLNAAYFGIIPSLSALLLGNSLLLWKCARKFFTNSGV
jgi:hypothetical protein